SCAARAPANWSRSVDLPTPGSPPSSTTEPGTSPPPRTRSTSDHPVAIRSYDPSRASERVTAVAGVALADFPAASPTSTRGSPEPHCGQKPIHFPDRKPHVAHLKAVSDATSA